MCKSVPTIATLSVPIKRYIATCPILINYWKARDCAFIHSWSQFIHSQTKWWKHTLFTFYFFGDISKVCIKFAWQLDGMGWGGAARGCLYLFPQPCCLARWLAAFLARQRRSDRQTTMMTVIGDVAAFRPSIPQSQWEEQVQKMENKEKGVRRETDRGRERLVEGNKEALLHTCSQCPRSCWIKTEVRKTQQSRYMCAKWYSDQPNKISTGNVYHLWPHLLWHD